MLLAPLVAFALAPALSSYPDGLPPYAPALGRPLAWDPYGAYALDAEGPLKKADAAVLDSVRAGELGRAETLCRTLMRKDGEDVLPAWVLAQIVRVRRTAEAEYRRSVEGRLAEPASPAVLLYRLHVCRLAFNETLKPPDSKPKFDRRQILNDEMKAWRDRLRPYADRHLGIAVAITRLKSLWALSNRAVLESYRLANPKGVDVRPLLCQAYNSGKGYGPARSADGCVVILHHADEPQPKKALEIALSILKDRPNDALGHFHAGRSDAGLGLASAARREIRAAVATGDLPPLYDAAARQYLESGNEAAFLPKKAVY